MYVKHIFNIYCKIYYRHHIIVLLRQGMSSKRYIEYNVMKKTSIVGYLLDILLQSY